MWRGVCFLLLSMFSMAAPAATPAVAGPYHVEGSRILDAEGHEYLIRGTELPVATLKRSDIEGDAMQFGAFSASAFATLRHG